MSRIGQFGNSISRTTTQLSSNGMTSSLRRTQAQLFEAQQQISTGRLVNRPSDAPGKVSSLLMLEQKIQAREQTDRNLSHASTVLDSTDVALGEVTEILREIHSLALSQIGAGSDAGTRANQAVVVDGALDALLNILNRDVAGVGLFSGNQPRTGDQPVYDEQLGGVRYQGATGHYATEVGLREPLAFNTNGVEAFNALSGRVRSVVDLAPQATGLTRIADVGGAREQGVSRGGVELTVNGVRATVDLSRADTLGDVVTRMNHAISQIDPAAGALALDGTGFRLDASAGGTIQIRDLGPGVTARDLGIALDASAGSANGPDLNLRVSETTELTALGAGFDLTGGLRITQGGTTKTADFTGARTVQDLQNAVKDLNLGVRLQINDAGRGFNLVSEISGVTLSVSDVAGGTTAADLGLSTFSLDTLLDDLRHGKGVQLDPAGDDLRFDLGDGTTFTVNLNGARTVRDVVSAIEVAAVDVGLTVGRPGDAGTTFNLGLASGASGLAFEDRTGGPGSMVIESVGLSHAAANLGVAGSVSPGGGALVGEDVAGVRVQSLFTDLHDLRESLRQDDSAGIRFAAESIEKNIDQLIQVRAGVSVRAQRVEDQKERSQDMGLTEQSMLSELRDADLTEVITRFQTLQLQLQASLQVGAQTFQLSLLDFLR